LHCKPPVQSVPQAWLLQAWFIAQSVWLLQPQVPPVASAMQILSVALVVQLAHRPPMSPQRVLSRPFWQVVPSQQPPLQGEPAEHAVVHRLPLQAWFIGQSAAVVHLVRHIPPAEHACVALHVAHEPPPVPHAVEPVPGWQLVPSQQPPLHWAPPEQVVPQV
jgi:hypothetical protein